MMKTVIALLLLCVVLENVHGRILAEAKVPTVMNRYCDPQPSRNKWPDHSNKNVDDDDEDSGTESIHRRHPYCEHYTRDPRASP
ncbi:hypothetical protein C2S51_026378 [Perilla frutescens var. frutescens]|nr:hypothetical protein C2S51_026378 [Perilla frutescens var. frutescens]